MVDFVRWLAPAALLPAAAAPVAAPALVPLTILIAPHAYAARYLSVEQAQAAIFPEAREFISAPLRLTRDQAKEIESLSGVRVRVPEQPVWEARTAEGLVGWFIVDEVIGKHELITYAVGLNADGSVRQIEVMDYRESYGYEIRNPAWRRQFAGKRQGDALELERDIRNISGATLSCRHITEGVKRLLALHQSVLR
jgi:Na+-translocating ferredoxin:NAD+ oxidoreductase RnfG subunit